MTVEFKEWPKINRWSKQTWIITEKIDGTNACVIVPENPEEPLAFQSRQRIITPENDNYGFAKWATEHAEQLRHLGPGYHYGEWWGPGIQGNWYGLQEKRFSLFDPQRYSKNPPPPCCHLVPLLEIRTGDVQDSINYCMSLLRERGSQAAPGCMKVEGIVIYNCEARMHFKKLMVNDEGRKNEQASAQVAGSTV